jgi:hypothetical protein
MKAPRIVAILFGMFLTVFGFWAFFGTRSFFDQIANFPPYNRHLLHDIGAFQIGIGLTLFIATVWTDALAAALAGSGIGAAMHAVAHWWDRDLGGRSSDPYALTVLAGVVLAAAWVRRRSRT